MLKFSDSEKSAPLWSELEKNTNTDFVDAMRELYSLYDAGIVRWYAGLFDTELGGFYYSTSAHDNESVIYKDKEYLLLPDVESTYQALSFINASGLSVSGGNRYTGFLPTWMIDKIGDFTEGLQDPDGYYYHPQWGKKIPVSRRGRDHMWARGILKAIGRGPRYASMTDKKPNPEKQGEPLIPEHLIDEAAFRKYLEELNIPEMSYNAGNTLASQSSQIAARGLLGICIDHLDALQHTDTGHWHSVTDYFAINGLMKISGVYNAAGRPLPNAKAAAYSAIAAISSEEPIRAVVDLWNTWVAVDNITSNLRRCGGEEGERVAREILEELKTVSVSAIRKTREKIAPFKKPDSAFSYLREYPCPTSQGMPVTIPGIAEGDVNASVMSMERMVNTIYESLGLTSLRVPIFGAEEGEMFLSLIEDRRKRA